MTSPLPAQRAMARMFVAMLAGLAAMCTPAAATTSFTDAYDAHDDEAWVGETCKLRSPITGAEPDGSGPFPVFIWVTGTGAEGTWSGRPSTLTQPFDQALAKAAVRKAAASGFVAAFGQYRGRWTVGNNLGTDLQAKCMFSRSAPPRSILDAVCERPKADCSRVVVAGHSQGGMIAMRAANHAAAVKAAWATSVFVTDGAPASWISRERGGQRALPDSGLRIATGYDDLHGIPSWFTGASYRSLRDFTGLACADRTRACSRGDGSGWYVIPHQAPPVGPTDGFADHCFMSQNGRRCTEPQPVDPFWLNGQGEFTLHSNLDWLASRLG